MAPLRLKWWLALGSLDIRLGNCGYRNYRGYHGYNWLLRFILRPYPGQRLKDAWRRCKRAECRRTSFHILRVTVNCRHALRESAFVMRLALNYHKIENYKMRHTRCVRNSSIHTTAEHQKTFERDVIRVEPLAQKITRSFANYSTRRSHLLSAYLLRLCRL